MAHGNYSVFHKKWKVCVLGTPLTLQTNRVCIDACIYRDMGILGKDTKKLEKRCAKKSIVENCADESRTLCDNGDVEITISVQSRGWNVDDFVKRQVIPNAELDGKKKWYRRSFTLKRCGEIISNLEAEVIVVRGADRLVLPVTVEVQLPSTCSSCTAKGKPILVSSQSSSFDSGEENLPLSKEATEVDNSHKVSASEVCKRLTSLEETQPEDLEDLEARFSKLRFTEHSPSDVGIMPGPVQVDDSSKRRISSQSAESGYLSTCDHY